MGPDSALGIRNRVSETRTPNSQCRTPNGVGARPGGLRWRWAVLLALALGTNGALGGVVLVTAPELPASASLETSPLRPPEAPDPQFVQLNYSRPKRPFVCAGVEPGYGLVDPCG